MKKKAWLFILSLFLFLSGKTVKAEDYEMNNTVYRIAVKNGTAVPSRATSGTPVTIRADLSDDRIFAEWLGISTLPVNGKVPEITFRMPDHDLNLQAAYKYPHWHSGTASLFPLAEKTKIAVPHIRLSPSHRKTGWITRNGRRCFVKADGTISSGWQNINKKTYYLKRGGYPLTGPAEMDGHTYYFNEEGILQKGWQMIEGQQYYFDEITGTMTKGLTMINDTCHYFDEETGVYQDRTREIPQLWAENAYVMRASDSRPLFSLHPDQKIWPASMTKMMTVLLACENLDDLDHRIMVTADKTAGLLEAGLTIINYQPGDDPTIRDLLYTAMLPSAADSAELLAYEVSGTPEAFIDLMNEKARELGMYDTHFANTHGNDDIYNYSTCHDMALLLAYAAGNPLFREIMSTSEYAITPVGFFPDGAKYQSSVLRYCEGYNGRYQFRFEGLAGGKSGYTPDARYTLALVCSPGGEDIVYVTARSWKEQYYPAHIEDASVLAEYLK